MEQIHEKHIIAWKKAHCCYNPDSPLAGHKWFRNFCKRSSLSNRNTLDCAQILATAPDSVQEERNDGILRSRGIALDPTTRSVIYSQQDLLVVGSGPLARGGDVGQRIANTVASVNLSGYTASGIMSLMNDNEKKNKTIPPGKRSSSESLT